ncbi:hypothetical protein ACV3NF_03145 [Clostridium perfringens]
MNLSKHFKGEKLNIHMFYWILILVLTIIVLFTTRAYSNESLAEQVAFGATLSGIILSVIAIIMTLIGETKSDNTKDKLVNLSDNLEGIVSRVEVATSKLKEATNASLDMKSKLDNLEVRLTKSDLSISNGEDKNNDDEYITVFNNFCATLKTSEEFLEYYCLGIILASKKAGNNLSYFDLLRRFDELNIDCELVHNSLWGVILVFSKAIKNDEFSNYVVNYLEKNFDTRYENILDEWN